MVYLPTFTIKINHSCIGKYTSPMDPMGRKKTQRFSLDFPLRFLCLRTAFQCSRTLGYGEGYIYNPSTGYVRGCEQGYLPPELQGQQFFSPEDCEPGHSLHFCEKRDNEQNSPKRCVELSAGMLIEYGDLGGTEE